MKILLMAILGVNCMVSVFGVDYDRSSIPSVGQLAVSKESGGQIRQGSCHVNAEMQGVLWWYKLGLCRIPRGSGSDALRITRALTHYSPEIYPRCRKTPPFRARI